VRQNLCIYLKKAMDTNDNKFPQQEAPVKNTDHAFVQVGKDGHPVIPQTANDKQDKEREEAKTGNIRE
jgi:Fe-S cluster assembly scaffold protein SufB